MSLGSPSSCTPGQYYKYMPTFTSGDFAYQGGSFNFGSTISVNTAGANNTAWLYLPISNIDGLHVEAVYDFKEQAAYGVSDYAYLNGVGVAVSSINVATFPYAQGVDKIMGAWAARVTGPGKKVWVGKNKFTPQYTSAFLDDTLYSNNKITIDVGPNLGSFTYSVTVRLEVPSLGIDTTQTSTIVSGSSAGYVTICGSLSLTSTVFTVSQLYITGNDSALGGSCDIIPIGLAHGFNSWISIFQDDSINGNTFTLPQPLHVDADNLKFEKEILIK